MLEHQLLPHLNDSTSQNISIFADSKEGKAQSSSAERYLFMFKEIAYAGITIGKGPVPTLYCVSI